MVPWFIAFIAWQTAFLGQNNHPEMKYRLSLHSSGSTLDEMGWLLPSTSKKRIIFRFIQTSLRRKTTSLLTRIEFLDSTTPFLPFGFSTHTESKAENQYYGTQLNTKKWGVAEDALTSTHECIHFNECDRAVKGREPPVSNNHFFYSSSCLEIPAPRLW